MKALLRTTLLLCVMSALLFSPAAFAQDSGASSPNAEAAPADTRGIDIDVTLGVKRKLIPMAIPKALEPGGDTGKIAQTVHDTLARDMKLAGFFKVLDEGNFFFDTSQEGMGASAIGFSNWFNVGAQGLIKSSVRTNGDQVVLDLRLYLVEEGKPARLDWKGGSFSKDEYIKQVHAFANEVLKYYTGKPGIFGSRIAYVRQQKRNKQIYAMRLGEEGVAKITNNNSINMLPSFGPGGAIYYTSYQAGNPDLWVYEGGKSRKLSSVRGQNTGADYCNGKLALTLSKDGSNSDIYLIDPSSGKIAQRLTDHWAIDTSPSWSPDCSKIAFTSGRSGGPQIYVMNADGSNQRRLTYQGSYNTQPSWSPSGNLIAFSARDERGAFDIFTVNLEGSIERLTQDQGNNSDPAFSPDGRYLVFISDRGGKGKRVWMMTADGEVQNAITEGSGYQSPAWE
ncbi:DPP IV N-terminal domain-containing protein [Bradymonas sediminis]|nr:DPP IV N-terminal domain-containing protein [Bradymonas sediminis]TDP63712.1 TolB protein [Bradymonas sediminis]